MIPSRRTRLRTIFRVGIKAIIIMMNKRNTTFEQEDLLARIAMSERLISKHWRLLEQSGLLRRRTRWKLSPQSIFYIKMITNVHGPKMPKAKVSIWLNVIRMCDDPELVEQFWAFHLDTSLPKD